MGLPGMLTDPRRANPDKGVSLNEPSALPYSVILEIEEERAFGMARGAEGQSIDIEP